MPANKYALLRYRIIDRCLRNKIRPFPTKERLREACDDELYQSFGERVSDSTIEKDIYAMRYESQLGYMAPIAFNKLRRGYFYTDEHYSLDKLPLSDEEIEAIRMAAATLNQFAELEILGPVSDAIEKIIQRLAMGTHTQAADIKEIIDFERLPRHRGTGFLSTLYNAIRSSKGICMDYHSRHTGTDGRRDVWPWLLKEYRHLWYMVAYEYRSKKTKTFALDRIATIEMNPTLTRPEAVFDKKKFFKYSVGITATEDNPEIVKLRFDNSLRDFILLTPLHHSQRMVADDECGLVVELTVQITRELINSILWFGLGVEVLTPVELRATIYNEVSALALRLK